MLVALSRRYAVFGLVLLAIVLSESISFGLREAIGRDRPPIRFVEPEPLLRTPNSHSFPSGHSTTAFAAATILAVALPRFRVPLYCLAALIAWSRVVVGVHYPLDVLGGAVLGIAIGLALLQLFGRSHESGRDHSERGDQTDEDPDAAAVGG